MSTVTLEIAKSIGEKAVTVASRHGVLGVSVVVLDHTTSIRLAMRTETANLFGIDIAKAKALSAMAFRSTTLSQNETLGQNQMLVSALTGITQGKFLPLGGGSPIFDAQGVLIGAAAVAGSTQENDHAFITEAITASGLSTK